MSSDSPLLPLFKSQLEADCVKIAETHGLCDRGHWLIYWYFAHLHDFDDASVEEVICDGGGDLGIDALWIDDNDLVHFYQFKNPEKATKGISAGEIDKMLAGLRLILRKEHRQVGNPSIKARVQEIYQQVRAGYRIHIVSSGQGIPHESKVKLDTLVTELTGPSPNLVTWQAEDLGYLQATFYQQSLPAVQDPIIFKDVGQQPYLLKSGGADAYFLHTTGQFVADLYNKYGETLLQRNIRVDQGNTAANRSIETSCTGHDSPNFVHFNNGITFLCESAQFDPFVRSLTLLKAQVVNGGQTVRVLNRSSQTGSLKTDVLVPVRVITNSAAKDFALNVAVNQNNQNQMGSGFLRSNDSRVVQLDHALASLGWYLERRQGELASATVNEKAAIETRIGGTLVDQVIRLKEGTQAYVATFFGQPELAKKNVKKIFASSKDGGYFERVFSADMTAHKVIIAHQLKACTDSFVKRFSTKKRRKDRVENWKTDYSELLGSKIVEEFPDDVDQVMPQCSVFLCATIFRDFKEFLHKDPSELPGHLQENGDKLIREHLYYILMYARENKSRAGKSWPVLLKSNSFFERVCSYVQGIRGGDGN